MRNLRIFNIEINKTEIIGLILAFLVVIIDLIFLRTTNLFYFVLAIAFVIAGLPFFGFLVIESNTVGEKNRMFLEFSRNLVENVKAGTPISKSILSIQSKDYGPLNFHVQKLANQISLGIPLKIAFETFSRDVGSDTISRAINIMSESEKAGGEIEDVLESVVSSVAQIEKLKKDRRNAVFGLIFQGYVIFFIFIVILLVMQFKVLPIASGVGSDIGAVPSEIGAGGFGGFLGGAKATPEELTRPFLWLLIIQGLFTGLVIGKIAEGNIRFGLKHSFILIVFAVLINTGAKAFYG